MHLQGSTLINAPRPTVWKFLTDVQSVAQCAPGVESVEIIEPDKKFRATASVGFGSVKVKFSGDGEWVEMDEPNRAVVKGHGKAPGSAADVFAEMILSDTGDGGTEMKWSAEVNIMGSIASIASRMMGTVAQKLTGEFFNNVKQKIEKK
ncbi:MAG: carbon monoxide dehydrogenase subunit G [Chloroflexi bacterium]|nr:carbon monoxide dehydrogenase subunit G [Chloroflexota bacterium]